MAALRQVPRDRMPGTPAPTLQPGQISINEVYFTIQGECGYQGLPTVFVRTSHCNLRCTWCDSKYTFHEGAAWATSKVLDEVAKYPTRHVCLTGGEPLLQEESFRLVRALAERGYTVEVETSGSLDVSPFNTFPPDLRAQVVINLDVKCPASAMTEYNRWPNLAELRGHDQLKFIVGDRADYEYAKDVLARYAVPCRVYMHPVWKAIEPAQIAEWVKADGLRAHVGIQLHKYLWGDRRGV